MICNQNEKYLLKFISSANNEDKDNISLLDIVYRLGIKIRFNDPNPVYNIIEEINYNSLYK